LNAVKNQECYAAIINSIYAQKLQNEDIRSVYSFSKLSEGSLKLKIAVKNTEDGRAFKDSNQGNCDPLARIEFNAIVSRYSHFVKPDPHFARSDLPQSLPLCAWRRQSSSWFYRPSSSSSSIQARRKAMVLANREFERFYHLRLPNQ
jgi:hypothetical protein